MARALIDMPEDTLEQIAAKRSAFGRLHDESSWKNLKTACDLYVAAFFAPKIGKAPTATSLAEIEVASTDHVWSAARPRRSASRQEAAYNVTRTIGAFHWPLEFPHVFARGGFDVVAGNPPWEVSQLGEQEYFAAKSPEIAAMPGDARKQAIARLESDNPRLWGEFLRDKRNYESANEFFELQDVLN